MGGEGHSIRSPLRGNPAATNPTRARRVAHAIRHPPPPSRWSSTPTRSSPTRRQTHPRWARASSLAAREGAHTGGGQARPVAAPAAGNRRYPSKARAAASRLGPTQPRPDPRGRRRTARIVGAPASGTGATQSRESRVAASRPRPTRPRSALRGRRCGHLPVDLRAATATTPSASPCPCRSTASRRLAAAPPPAACAATRDPLQRLAPREGGDAWGRHRSLRLWRRRPGELEDGGFVWLGFGSPRSRPRERLGSGGGEADYTI